MQILLLLSSGRSELVIATTELFSALLSPLYGQTIPHYQHSSIMSLGHCNPDCYEILAKQLKALFDILEGRVSSKQKAKYQTEEVNGDEVAGKMST